MMDTKKLKNLINSVYYDLKLNCDSPCEAAEVLLNVHVNLYLRQSKDSSVLEEYMTDYTNNFKELYNEIKVSDGKQSKN